MIKILLVDDLQMFTDGIKFFLETEEDFDIVGTALSGDEAISFLDSNQDTNVVIMDIEMPGIGGVEATRIIRSDERFKNLKILVLSMYNQKHFIVKLLDAGVNGYILKNKSKEELVEAIRKVYYGSPHFGLEILTMASSSSSRLDKLVELTNRERQILCLIAEGKITKEIALNLNITEGTVNTHRKNLLRKLDFPNDKYLVRYAIKHGYIEP